MAVYLVGQILFSLDIRHTRQQVPGAMKKICIRNDPATGETGEASHTGLEMDTEGMCFLHLRFGG